MKIKSLNLLTFNVFGIPVLSSNLSDRGYLICKRIESMGVDVVNFQEVHTYSFLKVLCRELTAFPYCIYGRGLFGPRGGLVTFSKRPIKKISYVSYKVLFDKTFHKTLSSLVFRKGVLVGQISDDISIVNTHLTSYHEDDISSKDLCSVHLEEVNQLARLVGSIGDGKSVIVSGDFNIAKSSNLYTEFVERLGVKDVFADENIATYHQEYLPNDRLANCIDYVLFCGALEIEERELVFTDKEEIFGVRTYLSDHLGLFVKFCVVED